MNRFADPGSRVPPGPTDRVLVLGLGTSGEAAARALLKLGAAVTIADAQDSPPLRARAGSLSGARVLLGENDPAAVRGADLVVASPGISPATAVLRAAREAGIPVWSEIELAWRLSRAALIGVTGTNGKTTTTAMAAAALAAAGRRAAAAGNIGFPLTDAVAGDADVFVAELSSFQLEHVVSLRVDVAVLLNLADDHLDWHGSFERYAAAKARIFERQRPEDAAVVHRDCARWAPSTARVVSFREDGRDDHGAGVEDGWIVVPEGRVAALDRLPPWPPPLLADAVAASAAACLFGAAPEAVGRALMDFRPAPHRTELVGEAAGVRFVNDSKATNPHATLAALSGIDHGVLIAGGRNKGVDLRALVDGAARLRAVVAIGEAADEIADVFAPCTDVAVVRAASMDEAVERAAALAQPGDTVLLSPGCASFDWYADYRARGEAFRAAVKGILAGREGSE